MNETPVSNPKVTAKRKPGRPRKAESRSLNSFMREVREAAEFTEGLCAELASLPGGLDSEFVFRTAQAVFEADVARRGDLKNHIALRKLRQADRAQDESHAQRERAIEQRERALELARDRFEFDAAAAALDHLSEVKTILEDRTLKRPAKIQAVRRRLFGEPPEPMPTAGVGREVYGGEQEGGGGRILSADFADFRRLEEEKHED